MRFLANENFPGAAVTALEGGGHDVGEHHPVRFRLVVQPRPVQHAVAGGDLRKDLW